MKSIEIEIYEELKDCLESIAHFVAEDIRGHMAEGMSQAVVPFKDDAMQAMMAHFNCTHHSNDIYADFVELIERELFFSGVSYAPIKIDGDKVIWKKR